MGKRATVNQLLKAEQINPQQAQVLQTLRKSSKPLSNRTLSVVTALPINVITPRCLQLRRMGLVSNAGREYDIVTNRTVMIWQA